MPALAKKHLGRLVSIIGASLITFGACNTTSSKVAFSKEQYQIPKESVLYVFRQRAFVGGGMKTVLFFNGNSVGILPQNGYWPIHALAGRHKLKGCSSDLLATEECSEINVDMQANDFTIVQLKMKLDPTPRVFLLKEDDLSLLADNMNEGDYYDLSLRDLMPKSARKIALTATTLGKSQAGQAAAPLKIAILNFTDKTDTNLYGWLSASLSDAVDQSMRKEFEYKRPNPAAAQQTADKSRGLTQKQLAAALATNLIISGQYALNPGGTTVRIEAQIYYADSDAILGSESIDSPIDAGIFSATKTLSDKLVAKLHEIVRKK